MHASPADRAAAREQARREMERMSKAMVEEKGLLNHAQAARLLGVSTKRVSELVWLGKLTRFDFAGRTYVSMQEIRDRNKQALKAGRPPRAAEDRIAARLEVAVKTDTVQARLGGDAESYFQKRRKEADERRRAEFKKRWHVREGEKK